MNKKIILFFKLLISAILLIYIYNKIPLEKMFDSIMSANYFLIIVALLLMIPVAILSAYQTTILTRAQNSSICLMEVVKIYLATSFYAFFLPGSLSGGAVKWYKFSKSMTKSSAAAIIIFNRFLELFIVLVLGLFYYIISFDVNKNNILVVTFVILFSLLSIGYILFLSTNVTNKLKITLDKKKSGLFIIEKVLNLLDALIKFRELKSIDHLKILGIMVIYHLINLISFYLLAISLNISVNIWVLGWIGVVITLLSLLPITISGLGIREGSLVYFLGIYGIAPYYAVALSLLALLRIISIASVGGLIELKDYIQKNNNN